MYPYPPLRPISSLLTDIDSPSERENGRTSSSSQPMKTKTAARPKRPAMQIYVPPKLRTALERKSSCERLSESVSANGDVYAETKDVHETKSPQADQHKHPAMQPQLHTAQERQNSCERLSEAASVNEDLHAETGHVQETKSPQADQHKRPAMQVFLPPQLRIAQEHQSSYENLSEPTLVNGDVLAETKDLQEPKLPQTDEHKCPAIHVPLQSQLPTEKERQNSCERLSEPAPANGDLHAESKDVQETKSPQADQYKRPAVRTYVPPQLRTAQARQSSSDDSSTSAQPAQAEPPFKSLKIKQKSKEAVAVAVAEADKLAQKLETVSVTSSESAPAPLISGFEDNGLLVIDSWEKPAVVKVPLGVASSKVLLPEPTLNYGELQHIIELYGFPPTLESLHLQTELRGFEDSGFVLKWVDDTHCLAVFSSPTEATTALKQISGILIKARPVEEASRSSKWKIAKSPGDWAMPYKPRPATDSSVANRIISAHLNLPRRKASSAKNGAVKTARERAQQRRRNQEAMWGDDDEN